MSRIGRKAWHRKLGPHDVRARHKPRLAPWQEQIAKEQMDAELPGLVRIRDVARSCRLSPGHFVTAFTNTVGMSPYRWFLERRIDRARKMLGEEQMTLAEIALECGFSDQSHFTKAFRRVAGTTPGVWRRRRREVRQLEKDTGV